MSGGGLFDWGQSTPRKCDRVCFFCAPADTQPQQHWWGEHMARSRSPLERGPNEDTNPLHGVVTIHLEGWDGHRPVWLEITVPIGLFSVSSLVRSVEKHSVEESSGTLGDRTSFVFVRCFIVGSVFMLTSFIPSLSEVTRNCLRGFFFHADFQSICWFAFMWKVRSILKV